MLQKTYDWTMSMAAHPRAIWVLAAISFAESSVFPIPPDVLLLPMILANRNKAWLYAGVCTVASVAGGYFGYLVGMFLFEQVGHPVLTFYGKAAAFDSFSAYYNEWGGWIVAAGGVTPLPYKVITIASGATALDPLIFGVASVLSRGFRFFLEAVLLYYIGPPIREFVEKRLALMATLAFVLLFGGFLAVRFLL